MPFLIFENNSGNKAIPIDRSIPFKIGRSMDNDLRLREDSMISRFHSTITYSHDTEEYMLEDLDSSNGSFVNNNCLMNEKIKITDMDQITIGNIAFIFLESDTVQYDLTTTTTIMVNSPTPDISAPEPKLMSETARLDILKPVKTYPGAEAEQQNEFTNYPEIKGYEIINILGSGSSQNSTTYLAFQNNLKRSAAIKIFDTTQLTELQKEDFFTNVRIAGKLQHQNIISYIDTGGTNRECYLSMLYAESGNLTDMLALSPIKENLAVDYMIQLIKAMSKAHNSKIIHYNITPNNILFNKNGNPAISDFGLAEWVSKSYQVNRNYFFGSTKYMSPEQMLDKSLDWTCDQYALGAIFYEMLTGVPPFDAPSIYALIEKHVREKVRFPTKTAISTKNKEIILKMMQKAPKDRFLNWNDILNAFTASSKPKKTSQSRKNIPLQSKKMNNIVKKKNVIQIPTLKKH